ncbi:MAG: DUF3575 domain-containing protein [Planctomycetes bacterium]|nr:DUF3575 domain-containing protein [Planctomycetota bacterium]
MRSTRVVLLFLIIAVGVSCGAIPPYSSVNKQAVKGFYTLKIKSAAASSNEMSETSISADSSTDISIYQTSSAAIELEKVLRDQVSVVFAVHKREYTIAELDNYSVNGNQIHAGVRRYFGDRALTGFIAAEGIYTINFNHPGLNIDFQSGPGWAIGGGLNFALNESLSLEASLFHETIWPMASYASGNTSLPSDFEHAFNGAVAYIGLGLHF